MRSLFLTLAVVAASASISQAAFVSFATGGARGHQILLSDGATRVLTTADNPGSRASIGYLTTPGDSSSFVEFATTTINHPLSTATVGGFINTPTGNNASQSAVDAYKGKQVAIWIYGQNGEQGLFTSTAWTVPASITTEVDSSFDITLGVTQASGLPPVQVTTVPIPGMGAAQYIAPVNITVGTASNTAGASYILGAIPEPSSMGLLVLAGLATLRRRR